MKSHIDEFKNKRHVPDGAIEQRFDDLDLVFYLYPGQEGTTTVLCICYEGRKTKPSFHYRFESEIERKMYIKKWLEDRKKEVDAKLKLLEERRDFKTTFKVGDILSSSWGYEQTNVDFFQVIEVKSPKRVVIQKIQKKLLDDNHGYSSMAGKVIPVPDGFLENEEPILKQVTIGDRINFSSFQSASRWSGNPQYCSWYA